MRRRPHLPYEERARRAKISSAAQRDVLLAVKAGRLAPRPCDCGSDKKPQAHHTDYSRPLAVMWLCPKCHYAWHRNNDPVWPDAPLAMCVNGETA